MYISIKPEHKRKSKAVSCCCPGLGVRLLTVEALFSSWNYFKWVFWPGIETIELKKNKHWKLIIMLMVEWLRSRMRSKWACAYWLAMKRMHFVASRNAEGRSKWRLRSLGATAEFGNCLCPLGAPPLLLTASWEQDCPFSEPCWAPCPWCCPCGQPQFIRMCPTRLLPAYLGVVFSH